MFKEKIKAANDKAMGKVEAGNSKMMSKMGKADSMTGGKLGAMNKKGMSAVKNTDDKAMKKVMGK